MIHRYTQTYIHTHRRICIHTHITFVKSVDLWMTRTYRLHQLRSRMAFTNLHHVSITFINFVRSRVTPRRHRLYQIYSLANDTTQTSPSSTLFTHEWRHASIDFTNSVRLRIESTEEDSACKSFVIEQCWWKCVCVCHSRTNKVDEDVIGHYASIAFTNFVRSRMTPRKHLFEQHTSTIFIKLCSHHLCQFCWLTSDIHISPSTLLFTYSIFLKYYLLMKEQTWPLSILFAHA